MEFTDKGRHLLVVMIIVCIGLMLVTMTSPRIAEPVRTAAGIVVAPFQNGVNEIGKYVTKAFSGFRDVQKLSEENKALREEISELTQKNNELVQNQT